MAFKASFLVRHPVPLRKFIKLHALIGCTRIPHQNACLAAARSTFIRNPTHALH